MPTIPQTAEYLLSQLTRCTTEREKLDVIESVLEQHEKTCRERSKGVD